MMEGTALFDGGSGVLRFFDTGGNEQAANRTNGGMTKTDEHLPRPAGGDEPGGSSGPCPLPGAVYLAPRGFEAELEEELARNGRTIVFRRDRLIGTEGDPLAPAWAQNVWLEPRLLPADSISGAAARLKAIQRNWALYSTMEHRRAALIEAALPKVSAKPLVFGQASPSAPLGSWTMWSREWILASARCGSPFVHGEARFVEDKTGPPNRAYLKLWELFTRIGRHPGPGDLCLDLGSAPGGWTHVLAGLGARVFSLDKAPLAPHIAGHSHVEHCLGSAFAMEPCLAGNITWLFSDVACYPDKLYAMVKKWLDADVKANMVCTIKFVGKTDFTALDLFLQVPGSFALHLFANKHELTWVRLVI